MRMANGRLGTTCGVLAGAGACAMPLKSRTAGKSRLKPPPSRWISRPATWVTGGRLVMAKDSLWAHMDVARKVTANMYFAFRIKYLTFHQDTCLKET
jgi:hypothetical protein